MVTALQIQAIAGHLAGLGQPDLPLSLFTPPWQEIYQALLAAPPDPLHKALLQALGERAERICDAFDCVHEEHLLVPLPEAVPLCYCRSKLNWFDYDSLPLPYSPKRSPESCQRVNGLLVLRFRAPRDSIFGLIRCWVDGDTAVCTVDPGNASVCQIVVLTVTCRGMDLENACLPLGGLAAWKVAGFVVESARN